MNQTSVDLSSNNSSDFSTFCQILKIKPSLRCVAESKALRESLDAKGEEGNKFRIIKLPCEMPQQLETARQANEKGYAVFWMPSLFAGGYSETYKEIKEFRALVVDLDGAPVAGCLDFGIKPTVIIESSPGKYQAIWRIKSVPKIERAGLAGVGGTGITCDEYNEISCQLSALFEGDLNVCRATQPFRAPGFFHWKKSVPFQSRIYWTGNDTEIELTSLQALLSSERASINAAIQSRTAGQSGQASGMSVDPRKSSGTENREFKNLTLHDHVTALQRSKVDLELLRHANAGKVGLGLRHATLLRLCCLLLHEGKSPLDAREICKQVIASSFESPEDFLNGSRGQEIDLCMQDAERYVVVNKEKEAKVVHDVIAKAEIAASANGGSHKVSEKDLSFSYEYTGRTLGINKYSESAVVDRVLQRFGGDLVRVGAKVYCFNAGERLWIQQTEGSCRETKARVLECVRDMVCEPDFIREKCCDAKGKFVAAKKIAAEEHLYKISVVGGACRSVLNDIAVPEAMSSDFDADIDTFYCANVALNMRSGALRDAEAKDKLFWRSAIKWNHLPVDCPGWRAFLEEVFAENDSPASMVSFMQELFGYSLSGAMTEEKIFCHYGQGANGKSKTLEALRHLMGGYSTIISPDEITGKKGLLQKAFERMGSKIEGRRVGIIDDLEVATVWNEGFVKALTANEIRSEDKWVKSSVVCNRCKIHVGLNEPPETESENMGILRRLCIIPYRRTFEPSGLKRKELEATIAREAEGILQWAVEGYKRYAARGSLAYPAETLLAQEEYREEHFVVEGTVREMFGRPSSGSGDGTWEPLYLLSEDLNRHLQAEGHGDSCMNPEVLGRLLKNKFRLESSKRRVPGKENMVRCYLVKLKYTRQNANSLV